MPQGAALKRPKKGGGGEEPLCKSFQDELERAGLESRGTVSRLALKKMAVVQITTMTLGWREVGGAKRLTEESTDNSFDCGDTGDR